MGHGKKLLCWCLCLLLIVCTFAGCSELTEKIFPDKAESGTSPTAKGGSGKAYAIGLIQYEDDPSFNTVREAFMSRLEEWNYGEEWVSIDYQNAGGDRKKADNICKKFVQDGVDLIVAVSTPAAQAAVSAAGGSRTNVLFAGVNGVPNDLGVQQFQSPEGSVTGTWYKTLTAEILDLAIQSDPKLKTLGLLYDPNAVGAQTAVDEAKRICAERGLAVQEASVGKPGDVPGAAASLLEKVDAVYTPASSILESSTAAMAEAVRKVQKPWYAETEFMVQGGALAAVSIDYADLGTQTADMAVELMAGKAVSQVPVCGFEQGSVVINQTTLDILKTLIPDQVQETADFYSDGAAA